MPLAVDPDLLAAYVKLFGDGPPSSPPEGEISERRHRTRSFHDKVNSVLPMVTDVRTNELWAKADDGHDLRCRWFYKWTGAPQTAPSSAILYAHGGGMISADLDCYDEIIRQYVTQTGVPMLVVDYRLAPEAPAPTQVTDCYAGLQLLVSHAKELGVDPSRIGIMGDSAGGGITASLAHYVKLRGGPAVRKQILIYPMLDDRNITPDPLLAPFYVWSYLDNKTAWDALLGPDHASDPTISPVYAAGRMEVTDAKGLPDAYIDVGELDIFRDEDLDYARKLGKAGVSCETRVVPGAFHVSEFIAPNNAVSKDVLWNRCRAIKSF